MTSRSASRTWLLLLAALGLAQPLACGQTEADDASGAAGAAAGAAGSCATDCGPCPAGSECLKAGSFKKPIIPSCLKLCATSDDCGPDAMCLIPGISGSGDAFCVSATIPAQCGTYDTGHCDFFGQTKCRDATTLMSGVDKIGVFCGWKLVHCPGGCDDSLPDGAPSPAKCLQ